MKVQIEDLFHEVADLGGEARVRYFDEHGIDETTRGEVESLLAFDLPSNSSFDIDIGHLATSAMGRFEPSGTRCGPYRLGTLLGRGGMGTVHLAERIDGEITQQVAVKLLRPGIDGPTLRHRFLAERQILATLSHPNIARLLDAGHREDGQPYLVMEYIEGRTIDAYTAALGTRQTLNLFLKVCAAVSYLHRNLVVHRDLKPANILVTEEGEPKLLDFGIAKFLDLTSDPSATTTPLLTPDYASPEQVAGGPITTATDMYSLGAVLYRLLTGKSPHRFESEPPGAVAAAIVGGEIVPPSKLAPGLKGDLEIILLKALRKEPQERYSTIEEFSEDLENYLELRPIRARKGDTWYRTRKLLRRYWAAAAAAALVMTSLSTGLLIANYQRSIAQRRFIQVRELASKLFDIDAEVRRTPGTTKARELIVRTSLEYLQRLAADVHGDPALALEVGNAYMRVARVQGVPISNNLGQMDEADKNLQTAEAYIRSVLASQPENRTAIFRSAQIAHDRMLLARLNGRSEQALAFARSSADWLEKFRAEKTDAPEASSILNTYFNVADQHMLGQQDQEALRLCSRGAEICRVLENKSYVGMFIEVSAEVLRRRGDLDEARKQIQEAVRKLDVGPPYTGPAMQANLVLALIKEGRILGEDNGVSLARPEEAIVPLERAFHIADDFVHRDPDDQNSRGRLAMAGITLANILRHSDAGRSLDICQHTLRHMAEIKDNSSFRRFEARTLSISTYALQRLGRSAEARQALDAAFERLRDVKDYPAEKVKPGSEVYTTLSALADYEAREGKVREAIEIYEKLLRQILAWGPNLKINLADAVNVSRVYTELALLYQRSHQPELASAFAAHRVELWQRWDISLPHNKFVRRQLEVVGGRPLVQAQ